MKLRIAGKLLAKRARWSLGAQGGRKVEFERVQRLRKLAGERRVRRKGLRKDILNGGADLLGRIAKGY